MFETFKTMYKSNPFKFGKTQFNWRNWFADAHTIVNPSKHATIISKASQKAANELLKKSGAFHREGVKGEPLFTALEVSLLIGAALVGTALYHAIYTYHQTWILGVLIGVLFIYSLAKE